MNFSESNGADQNQEQLLTVKVKHFLLLTITCLAGISSTVGQGLQRKFSEQLNHTDTTSITIKDVMIPVDEGTRLHGRLYLPDSGDESHPTIFLMTPYTVDQFGHRYGTYFARRGFTYLNVDIRGRGASEGTFRPMFGDGSDGVVVAEWVTDQPWNDGRVVTRGVSYHGMVQWQILGEGGESIETSVPTASLYPGWDTTIPNGIFSNYTVRWLSGMDEKSFQTYLFNDSHYWNQKYMEMHQSGRNYKEFGETVGLSRRSMQIFERWIQHPHVDDYWRSATPHRSDYSSIDVPILSITGHFDHNQQGALRYYRRHMQHGNEDAKRQHYLLLGPWNQPGTYNPQRELGGLTFADTAAFDMNSLHLQWFNWILRNADKPEMLSDQVIYYVMGTDKWRTAPSLEEVADTSRTLYLQPSDKSPNELSTAGTLISEPPENKGVHQYLYDPRETVDQIPKDHFEGEVDYTAPGAAFIQGPKLIYHSNPIEKSFEMSGQIQLDVWIELDVSDTDFAVWIYEVQQNGPPIFLGKSMLRSRHRDGVHTVRLVNPGTIEKYRFDRFNWTSRQIQKGSRIRLVIAPLNDPYWQKNYNSAKPVLSQTSEDASIAIVKLHMGPDHPSKLILPVRTE